jgi:TonB family protein
VPRARSLAVGVVLLIGAAIRPAGAQTGGGTDTTARATCEDSLLAAATDSITLPVVAQLRAFDSAQAVPRAVTDLVLYEIAQQFRAPAPLALWSYTSDGEWGKGAGTPGFAHLGVSAMYGFALDREGRLTGARTITSSLNPLLDQRMLQAMRAADSGRLLPSLPNDVRGKSAEMRLHLSTARRVAGDTGVVLFRLRTPRLRYSHLVRPGDNRRRSPQYPSALRAAEMDGSVMAQFVVDRDGNVEPRTINIVRATHIQFVKSVLEVLPQMRFEPARIAGCPVAQLVSMPFEFSITR